MVSIQRFALVLALVITHAAVARAQASPGSVPWFGSGEGNQVYGKVVGLARVSCPLENTAAQRKQLADYAAIAATAKDPAIRSAFVTHAKALSDWFETYVVGVPGVGSWAEIKALYDEAKPLSTLNQRPSQEQMQAKLADYVRAATLYPKVEKTRIEVQSKSPCPNYPGPWGDVAWQLKQVGDAGRSEGEAIARYAVQKIDEIVNASVPAGAPPATYWEHVAWVQARIDHAAKLGTLAKILDEDRPFAPLSTQLAEAIARGDAARASAEAQLAAVVTELRAVAMPPLRQDAARAKLLAAAVADAKDGSRVGIVVNPGGVEKEAWSEQVTVRREGDKIWVRDVKKAREQYVVYYAWKPLPTTAGAPALPGIAADEVCELWAHHFMRYTKGLASDKRTWFPSGTSRVGYLPCSATGTASTRPIK